MFDLKTAAGSSRQRLCVKAIVDNVNQLIDLWYIKSIWDHLSFFIGMSTNVTIHPCIRTVASFLRLFFKVDLPAGIVLLLADLTMQLAAIRGG